MSSTPTDQPPREGSPGGQHLGDPDQRTPALRAQGVRTGYGTATVLTDLDLEVEQGLVTTIIGPNGCGKSTLLRTLAGLSRPWAGHVEVDGRPVNGLSPRQLARQLAVLPQGATAPEGLTVGDLAARGRQPHQHWYRQWSTADEDVVAGALRLMHVEDLATRSLEQLSGGQRQRAWIAMCLAQQTPLLLLDEPTTHLDLAHAMEILRLVQGLARDEGRSVLMVLHDLSLAARHSDRLVAMSEGKIVASGAPSEVITETLLAEVFGLDARVFADPVDGMPTVAPR